MLAFPVSLHTKLPRVGTTIFTKMSALAAQHNAINLSQGFPDYDCDPALKSLVAKHMQSGKNQYAPLGGVLELREAIAQKTEELYGVSYNPETEVTITAGGTQAIFASIMATVKEGDEVIIFTPAYDCYEPAIELAGGKPVFVQLTSPDFSIDWQEVKKVVNRKTRMIILNTPHNPTGTILTENDLIELERLIDNSNIVVLSDEVYEHMVFDGQKHYSLCSRPTLAEHSIIVSSFGKTYHTTGWKIGYCLAPEDLMKEIRKVHQYVVFSVFTPAQYAYAEFLQNKDSFLELNAFYQTKRNFFNEAIKASRFKFTPSSGTYFQLLDYSAISDKHDVDFAEELTIQNKVASIPVSVFYHREVESKILRFCFAKEEETLKKAADILISL